MTENICIQMIRKENEGSFGNRPLAVGLGWGGDRLCLSGAGVPKELQPAAQRQAPSAFAYRHPTCGRATTSPADGRETRGHDRMMCVDGTSPADGRGPPADRLNAKSYRQQSGSRLRSPGMPPSPTTRLPSSGQIS